MLKFESFAKNCSNTFQNNLPNRTFVKSIELSHQLHYQNAAILIARKKSQSHQVDFFSIIIIPSAKLLKL